MCDFCVFVEKLLESKDVLLLFFYFFLWNLDLIKILSYLLKERSKDVYFIVYLSINLILLKIFSVLSGMWERLCVVINGKCWLVKVCC